MKTIVVKDIKDLPKLVKIEMEKLVDEVQLAMAMAADQGVAILVNRAAAEGIHDLGTYEQGFTVHETDDGAIITNEAPHAAIVEEGSKPHFPPMHPILEYMSRKLGGPATIDVSDSTRYDLSDAAVFKNDSKLEGIRLAALSVCRKIGANGTKPKRVMERSLSEIMDIVKDELLRIGISSNG